MPDNRPSPEQLADHHLGHQPLTADDIVVLVSDVIYEYLPPDSGITPKEALDRLLTIIETPLALEIYERELERRQPRDANRWH